MTVRNTIKRRRGELLVELFLQDLEPEFLWRPASVDVGYDLLVGFRNERGGINTFTVEIRAMEKPPRRHFPISRSTFDRTANSNVPSLLIVADVKKNRLYYAWLRRGESHTASRDVFVPITEIDDATTKKLKLQLRKANAVVAAVG